MTNIDSRSSGSNPESVGAALKGPVVQGRGVGFPQAHKFLGSDGKYHLSECLLVAYAISDNHCTCLDWYPD